MEKVTEIGEQAFYGCTSLATLDLGSVESIGLHAFRDCSALKSLNIPDSVRAIAVYISANSYY